MKELVARGSRKKGGGQIIVGADTVGKTGLQIRSHDGEEGSSEGQVPEALMDWAHWK